MGMSSSTTMMWLWDPACTISRKSQVPTIWPPMVLHTSLMACSFHQQACPAASQTLLSWHSPWMTSRLWWQQSWQVISSRLSARTLDDLLKPENKATLVDILTYHVLPVQVLSTDLKTFQAVKTVEGKPVHVIKYHGEVKVGPSVHDLKKVTGADNLASNGVAHIIDGVLLPPAGLSSDKPNIVELAQSVDDLSTLVAAVVAGDLVETLSSPGPFTVFAPTNEAFGALPAGTLDSLLKPENKDQLVDILTYHVLPAQVLSTDLNFFQAVKTVEGKEVLVSIYKGDVYANKAKVVGADNLASNGVAHIIDGVLLPKADDVIV